MTGSLLLHYLSLPIDKTHSPAVVPYWHQSPSNKAHATSTNLTGRTAETVQFLEVKATHRHRRLGFRLLMSPTRLTHANLRPSPPHVRKVTAKAPRSALVTRTTSSSKLTLRGATTSKSKVEKERTKPHDGDEEEVISADEDEMGTSFLQFWFVIHRPMR